MTSIHKNLTAYNNYEKFSSKTLKEKYRQAKLQTAIPLCNCISKLFPSKKHLLVTELGSGNSKALYKLEQMGIIQEAIGIEVSEARYKFAEEWAKDYNFAKVRNVNENFLTENLFLTYTPMDLDLVFAVDLSFQFAEPLKALHDIVLLQNIYSALNKDGVLILELDGCNRIISTAKNTPRIWEEFQEPDPWRFSLWECKYNGADKHLAWKKIFISRNNKKIDESEILLKIYDKQSITSILRLAGFKNIEFYKNFEMNIFENDLAEFVVVAKK